MTASEFAFLALGLVLGVASGAALSIVIRARPPAPREVRVTVAPGSLSPRPAATLSGLPDDRSSDDPARGGPADPAELLRSDLPATVPTAAGQPRGAPAPAGPFALASRTSVPSSAGPGQQVAIQIQPRRDPYMAALEAVRVGARRNGDSTRPNGGAAQAGAAVAVALAVDDSDAGPAADPMVAAAEGTGASDPSSVRSSGLGTDPACVDERRVADERCALAGRLQEEAGAAADRLREARRNYDDHDTRAAAAAAEADPRTARAAKEVAWDAFRQTNARAHSPDAVESAARDWLQDIDRINGRAREGAAEATREQASANALVTVIERLELEANAARINAESADEGCIAARESLAACEEAAAAPVVAAAAASVGRETVQGGDDASRPRLVGGPEMEPGELALDEDARERVFGDVEPLIVKLLRGDRVAMNRVVVGVAGSDPAEQRHWQLRLGQLVEAIVARAIEASAFQFPHDHPFWGPFTQTQCRDIATALASLGYRFDGLGGFADDRVPSQRDLSLAVGYGGLDPMRIRQWPNEQAMTNLYREVEVAADEFLAGAAGSLTLGEMVALLRGRAEDLTDLWNAWGRVRPLLLQP